MPESTLAAADCAGNRSCDKSPVGVRRAAGMPDECAMTDIWIVFAIIAAVIGLFIWDRLPVIAVCVGCALALWATGVLTLNQSLAGFGDPATVFVASLFVVSAALEKTGITAWAGQALISGAGTAGPRLLGLMMLFARRAFGADQRERRGGGAPAHGGGHRGAPRLPPRSC